MIGLTKRHITRVILLNLSKSSITAILFVLTTFFYITMISLLDRYCTSVVHDL